MTYGRHNAVAIYVAPSPTVERSRLTRDKRLKRANVGVYVGGRSRSPAVVYLVVNLISYPSLERINASVFTAISQLKVLATALFAMLMLRTHVSGRKWRTLTLMVMGVTLISWESAPEMSQVAHSHHSEWLDAEGTHTSHTNPPTRTPLPPIGSLCAVPHQCVPWPLQNGCTGHPSAPLDSYGLVHLFFPHYPSKRGSPTVTSTTASPPSSSPTDSRVQRRRPLLPRQRRLRPPVGLRTAPRAGLAPLRALPLRGCGLSLYHRLDGATNNTRGSAEGRTLCSVWPPSSSRGVPERRLPLERVRASNPLGESEGGPPLRRVASVPSRR